VLLSISLKSPEVWALPSISLIDLGIYVLLSISLKSPEEWALPMSLIDLEMQMLPRISLKNPEIYVLPSISLKDVGMITIKENYHTLHPGRQLNYESPLYIVAYWLFSHDIQ
jgi:hypothetical protein